MKWGYIVVVMMLMGQHTNSQFHGRPPLVRVQKHTHQHLTELTTELTKGANKALDGKDAQKNRKAIASGGSTWLVPECDVTCYEQRQGGMRSKFILENGAELSLIHSYEGPKHYPSLVGKRSPVRPKPGLAKYNGRSTIDRESDVPLTYFTWYEYNLQRPAVDPKEVIQGASFAAKNCGSLNRRENLVKLLQEHIRVDSVSRCLHNAPWPTGLKAESRWEDQKIRMMERYMFHFAFENENSDDYITEKMWGSLESGTLPVYYGAPNALKYVPPKAVIHANQYDDKHQLGEYLSYLLSNHTAYLEHHAWRYKPYPDYFLRTYNFTHVKPECRSCRWLTAAYYNLTWDHLNQKILYD